MMKIALLFILLTLGTLFPETLQTENQPVKTCGTSQINAQEIGSYLENLRRENPEAYQAIFQNSQRLQKAAQGVKGDTTFWAYKFTEGIQQDKRFYLVTATLKRTGSLTRIWVEKESLTKGYVPENILDTLLYNLEVASGAASIDPNKGIVEIDTMLFGQPPNFDGDGIVDFLILDIQDDFDTTATGSSSFIAGYFSPFDQTYNPTSNKMDLMYLDSYPGIFYQHQYRTGKVLSTTAHEFQHLIHYHYDQDEATWINEGLSELAGTYCGYGLDSPGLYLNNTNVNLMSWSGIVDDYARVNLWTVYCAEQLGLDFIKDLVQLPANNISGFNQAMQLSGNPGNLNTVFSNWSLANWINDRSVDPHFGYQTGEAAGLQAQPDTLITQYPPDNPGVSGMVKEYGAAYHQFRGRDSLRIELESGFPPTYWLVGNSHRYRVQTTTGNTIDEPGFTEDSTYVLLIYSLENDIFYQYQAHANFSLKYFELSYDRGQADINVSFNGFAANRFVVPDDNLNLERISFWNGSENNRVKLHVFAANATGNLPGSDLVSPIDSTFTIANTWADVVLPQPVTGLSKGDVVFAGVELTNKSIGYNDTNTPGFSFIKTGALWQPLSEREFQGGEKADGVWMIRAAFSGLVPSDSLQPATGNTTFVLRGNYPNPVNPLNREITIEFYAPQAGDVRFQAFNVLGQKVADFRQPVAREGINSLLWRGNGYGKILSSGIYFYRLIYQNPFTGKTEKSKFRKIVLVK